MFLRPPTRGFRYKRGIANGPTKIFTKGMHHKSEIAFIESMVRPMESSDE